VSGKPVALHSATSFTKMNNGQIISTCTEDCNSMLTTDFPAYFRHLNNPEFTRDSSVQFCAPISKNGTNMHCVSCNGTFTVDDRTPRLVLKNGQALFFDTHTCMNIFIKKPTKFVQRRKNTMVRALCPCDKEEIIATHHTPTVFIKGGQRIFLCSRTCVASLKASVATFLKPAQDYLPACPNATNLSMNCPSCVETFTIDDCTPRIQLNGGQCMYFHSYPCMDQYMSCNHVLNSFILEHEEKVPAPERVAVQAPAACQDCARRSAVAYHHSSAETEREAVAAGYEHEHATPNQ
jgi:YHS domain-containing protein